MTPLASKLATRISAAGPITLAEYMAECLTDPEHGYYTTRDPLGAQGDFTTAPEISQMFGELLGLCLAQAWLDRGAPDPFRLAELGPGRGTCMADILRATAQVPGFHAALTLHLVEASPALRDVQRKTIGHPLNHHDGLDGIPEGPLFLVANEFFDALPIRQFQRNGDGWRERLVGLYENGLSFGLSERVRLPALQHRLADTKDGEIVEYAPAAEAVAAGIGQRIGARGGVALIVDYGDWRSLGDTFQAVRAHEKVDPLADPGTADLTAHVDFEALARAARPARASAMMPQGVLLERLGITPRAQKIAETLSGDALEAHVAAHRRLTHPQEMGTLFKAMALYEEDTPLPAGFTA
ncbi:MAG: SAM-dependent methyltransferase [Alphaproteobacteria bacterium]|nr:SAM-dependent methyltransferase [Alphaproteobacteria bacterium]